MSQEEGEREGSAAGGDSRRDSENLGLFITGGPGTKLCAGERGEVRDMC